MYEIIWSDLPIALHQCFSGDEYYRFDEDRYEVMNGYPRKIDKFFTCEENNKKLIRNFRKEQLRGSAENYSYQLQSYSKLFYSFFTVFTILLIYGQF